jgi:hypothetical protein
MHIPILRDLLAGNWTYQDQGVLDRTHLRFFTLREMVKLFQNAGFNYVGYAPINLICSAEDEEFIKALQALPNVEKDDIQFKAQQFIIKAR